MQVVIEMLARGIDYPHFRDMYFSEMFNRELVRTVNLKERTLRERVQLADGKERLRMYIAPRVELPSMIAKLVDGFDIGYEEITLFDPLARRADVQVHTAGGDRLQVAAVTHFSDVPEGVKTRIELDVRVKILGLSTLIERFVVNETRARYVVVERTLQELIDSARAAPAS